jgi:hypothetical protein
MIIKDLDPEPDLWSLTVQIHFVKLFLKNIKLWQSLFRIRILQSSNKNANGKKTSDFYCFVTSLRLFIFEEWRTVNVPSKSTVISKKFRKHWNTDPEHCSGNYLEPGHVTLCSAHKRHLDPKGFCSWRRTCFTQFLFDHLTGFVF